MATKRHLDLGSGMTELCALCRVIRSLPPCQLAILPVCPLSDTMRCHLLGEKDLSSVTSAHMFESVAWIIGTLQWLFYPLQYAHGAFLPPLRIHSAASYNLVLISLQGKHSCDYKIRGARKLAGLHSSPWCTDDIGMLMQGNMDPSPSGVASHTWKYWRHFFVQVSWDNAGRCSRLKSREEGLR